MEHRSAETKIQIVYFSHGGGPLPILGDASHRAMVAFMRDLPTRLARPEAIVVISAHWEEPEASLQGAASPSMFYDYYGFPEAAYTLTYPACGQPDLAARITAAFRQQGIPARIDTERGFDHGLFIPLALMYPQADIPALQCSLIRGLDPAAHLALGRALRPLLPERLLVIGSGFSFHNMGAFDWQGANRPDPANNAFQDWLIETCTATLPEDERDQRLINWETAPSARYCHPREEHLLPLHVCQGLAGKPARLLFDDYILGKRSIALCW